MNAASIRTVSGGPELDLVRDLLREYIAHLNTFIPHAQIGHRDAELDHLPGDFAPPRGALLLATMAGKPAGCAALRPMPLPAQPAAAEFCRLWVTPAFRGRRLGTQLLAHAIELARSAGYPSLVLNSVGGAMQAAQTIYDRAGLHPTPPYKHVPIAGVAFYSLALTAATDRG